MVGETVVVPPDFKVAGGFLVTGAVLATVGNNFGAAVPFLAIGTLLGVQGTRVRFAFDSEALEVKVSSGKELTDSGENFAVGGKNRWNYNTFTHWQFYPSEEVPILVYFKETQTRPEGQIHFFPVIMDGKVLRDTMVQKRIPRLSPRV